MRAIAGSVVRKQRSDSDALRSKPLLGAAHERGATVPRFVGQDLSVGDAREVVDRDVDVLPPCAPGAAIHPRACDSVTWPSESTKLLDVEMQKLASVATLVA